MKSDENKSLSNYLFSKLSFEAIFISEEGRCIEQNEVAKELFGYTDEEARGKDLLEWIHSNYRELVAEKNKRNEVAPYKVFALRKDGSSFPCEVQARNFNLDGRTVRATALREITYQQKIEDQLKEKVKELEIITASIPNSIWKAKIDENGKFTETYISDSANQLLNLPPGTIDNDWEKYLSFVLPEYISHIEEGLKKGAQNPGKTYTVRYKVQKAGGEIAWFSSTGKGEIAENGVIAYGFTYDITSEKEKEDQLHDLMATKDKFFSIISHDLRNPFTAFMGFSELMLRQLKKQQYENLEKYARAIYSTASSGGELLSNLLDWSRAQRGKLQFRPEKINLHELLHTLMTLFREQAKSKEIEIETTIASDISLMADRNMLQTILRNLVSNAIKFSYRNSTIKLSIKQDDKYIIINVTDQGLGMTPEVQAKIFHIHTNESLPGTEEEKGTGLGLILVKDFVDKHNGQIKVESQPKKGSKFTVILPQSTQV